MKKRRGAIDPNDMMRHFADNDYVELVQILKRRAAACQERSKRRGAWDETMDWMKLYGQWKTQSLMDDVEDTAPPLPDHGSDLARPLFAQGPVTGNNMGEGKQEDDEPMVNVEDRIVRSAYCAICFQPMVMQSKMAVDKWLVVSVDRIDASHEHLAYSSESNPFNFRLVHLICNLDKSGYDVWRQYRRRSMILRDRLLWLYDQAFEAKPLNQTITRLEAGIAQLQADNQRLEATVQWLSRRRHSSDSLTLRLCPTCQTDRPLDWFRSIRTLGRLGSDNEGQIPLPVYASGSCRECQIKPSHNQSPHTFAPMDIVKWTRREVVRFETMRSVRMSLLPRMLRPSVSDFSPVVAPPVVSDSTCCFCHQRMRILVGESKDDEVDTDVELEPDPMRESEPILICVRRTPVVRMKETKVEVIDPSQTQPQHSGNISSESKTEFDDFEWTHLGPLKPDSESKQMVDKMVWVHRFCCVDEWTIRARKQKENYDALCLNQETKLQELQTMMKETMAIKRPGQKGTHPMLSQKATKAKRIWLQWHLNFSLRITSIGLSRQMVEEFQHCRDKLEFLKTMPKTLFQCPPVYPGLADFQLPNVPLLG